MRQQIEIKLVGAICSILVVSMVIGCDRSDDVEQDYESLEVDAPDEIDLDEAGTSPESAYDEFSDVEPVEPFDIGPKGPAIYFTSGLKGYTEPCGCTVDVLLGGIDRITAFVNDAVKLHPAAIFIDGGDWVFEYDEVPDHFKPQEKAKAEVLAAAHRQMETLFSVPGNRDLALGTEYYLSMMEMAGMPALGANLIFDGEPLQGTLSVELDGEHILFVGAGDPAIYSGIDGVEVSDDIVAIRNSVESAVENSDAVTVVLVYQGDSFRAERVAEDIDEVDFLISGHNPRREEYARPVGTSFLLEAYDQGRYVGRLKLFGRSNLGAFTDGRAGSIDQLESLDSQVEQVRQDLRRLQVRTDGEVTPMSERLRERLDGLEERRENLRREGIEIPADDRSFLYDLIAMEPGYRLNESIRQRRIDYNRSLAELNADIDREVIPVEEGQPFYIGTPECTTCHVEAHNFWEGTAHASAVATLEERHKEYDQNCIGCHVVGWEQPGGSVLGKISYEAELDGRTFMKDLSEVGCESCHGPGSEHRLRPLDSAGDAQHIIGQPTESQCATCHVPDHSPNFDFGVYVERITGEGHEYRDRN